MVAKEDSNASVFDLSLIHEHRHEDGGSSCTGDENPSKLPLSPAESYDSLPPLDSLTSEATAADDDSSVSTLGSTRSISSRRTVFSKYWNVTGQKPVSIGKRSDSSTSSPSSLSTSQRRSIIFSSSPQHSSCHSLPETVHERPVKSLERKSTSMVDLASVELSNSNHRGRMPRASCLKRDRLYSGDRKGSSNSLTRHEEEPDDAASVASAVRFDLEATDVRLYVTPIEVHAAEGWSEFFQ